MLGRCLSAECCSGISPGYSVDVFEVCQMRKQWNIVQQTRVVRRSVGCARARARTVRRLCHDGVVLREQQQQQHRKKLFGGAEAGRSAKTRSSSIFEIMLVLEVGRFFGGRVLYTNLKDICLATSRLTIAALLMYQVFGPRLSLVASQHHCHHQLSTQILKHVRPTYNKNKKTACARSTSAKF